MDEASFRILAEVLADPFASNEAIGRRIGITGASVRNRLAALADEVRFRGFRLIPVPECLGRVARGHFFRAPERDDALVERVMAADPRRVARRAPRSHDVRPHLRAAR